MRLKQSTMAGETSLSLLESFRQRSGRSYDQVAQRAWTSVSFVHRLCKGQAKASRDVLIRLGWALGLTLEELDWLLKSERYLGLIDQARQVDRQPWPEAEPRPFQRES